MAVSRSGTIETHVSHLIARLGLTCVDGADPAPVVKIAARTPVSLRQKANKDVRRHGIMGACAAPGRPAWAGKHCLRERAGGVISGGLRRASRFYAKGLGG